MTDDARRTAAPPGPRAAVPPVRRPGEGKPGRPRSAPKRHNGLSTQEEILQVASRLFGEQGYAKTTTRQIADSVGIKQSTLYYHFADKQAILASLLSSTVTPALECARWLGERGLDPVVRLCALVAFDLDTLLSDRHNLHVVYHLPELEQDDFAPTRAAQTVLRDTYRDFSRSALTSLHPPREAAELAEDVDLVFALVEASVSQRQWGGEENRARYAASALRGSLRLLGVARADIPDVVARAEQALTDYRTGADPGGTPARGGRDARETAIPVASGTPARSGRTGRGGDDGPGSRSVS
ncbi:TetR/AcrR family transcriptional regulator [Streptomyces acidicola]|uniref:TetR/AcrR family transcriptional regulator n=1 Tax=Streptomyces acidicola TaxID=2596892 RepID=UPI00378C80A2